MEILGTITSQFRLILLLILLGLMIRVYNYSKSDKKSFKDLLNKLMTNLFADIVIILVVMIIDTYLFHVDEIWIMILIVLSENLLNWLNSNQEKVTNSLAEKVLDLLIGWLNNAKPTKKDD